MNVAHCLAMSQFHLRLRVTATIAGRAASRSAARASIWCAVPSDSDLQRVIGWSCTFPGSKGATAGTSYTDAQGNVVQSFSVRGPEVLVESHTTLDLEQSSSPRSVRFGRDLRALRSEPTLRRTPAVRALARRLTLGARSPSEMLQRIFRFVTTSVTYESPVRTRGVEHLDLTDLRGDCGEMGGLLVALCRAVGIPARDETGFVLNPATGRVHEHGWASVLLAGGAWADVDPQYASLEPTLAAGEARYFLRRSDWRVSFTHGYNVPLCPPVPAGHDLTFWHDLGLPLTRDSVQVLQPLLLTAPRIVRLEDDHHVEKAASGG